MSKKILFAVLNWGLGHASRSIPLIKKLISEQNEIVIASDGEALVLLKKEFPSLIFEELSSYNVYYSEDSKNFDKTIFFQLNKFSKTIKNEHKQTKELILKYNINQIISDNRYGVYSKKIPSYIICHQINIQHKNSLTKKIINKIHHSLLDKFSKIWVPDFDNDNSMAGDISKYNDSLFSSKIKNKLKYIGLLSRMKKENLPKKYEICVVLSGPEPQRSILEKKLLKQLEAYSNKVAFVRGILQLENISVSNKNIEVFTLLASNELNKLMNQSELIVCRAGYSSIMDLVKLKKKAILIPTPGQTEQEYLARYFSKSILVSKCKSHLAPKGEMKNLFSEGIVEF